jgi:hypothetical protein
MLARERLLDRLLALAEPVERDIELILVDRSEAEHVAQARCRGERIEHAGGGQLGGRRNEPRYDHGDDEITATIAGRPEHTVETDVAQRAQHRRDMAVRQRATHDDGLVIGRRHLAALEQRAQPFDDLGRPIGQVGDSVLLDLAAVAIALAQQDRGRRIPVGDRFDIHGTLCHDISIPATKISQFTWLRSWPFSANAPPNSTTYSFGKKEVRASITVAFLI